MSIYSVKGKGWRYDFTLNGTRQTEAWFKTKVDAKQAEAKRKEELSKPVVQIQTPTDMAFLDLVNRRLDFVKAYKSEQYYNTYKYLAKRWLLLWRVLKSSEVTSDMIQVYLIQRREVSAYTANKDLKHLRATFNFGKKKGWVLQNSTDSLETFPMEKKVKYVPPAQDMDKVLFAAKPDIREYLWTLRDTMARVGEVNRMKWDDVRFEDNGGYVTLFTRKKKGGHLTPRKVMMTKRLCAILKRRYEKCDKSIPYVFANVYIDWKTGKKVVGQFGYRKTLLKTLCKKAKVQRFSYHPIRHLGASTLDSLNVPLSSIQQILGHENRTTTEIYLHSIDKVEQDAMRLYEDATNINSEESHTNSHTETTKEDQPRVSLAK